MRILPVRTWFSLLCLLTASGPGWAEETPLPDAELLEFLAQFAESEDEMLDLALSTVEDESDPTLTGHAQPVEERDDATR